MKKHEKGPSLNEIQITLVDFLASYNQNMPASFPRASVALLKKFQETHSMLFKHGETWSLDQHRKKVMDWLPQNRDAV